MALAQGLLGGLSFTSVATAGARMLADLRQRLVVHVLKIPQARVEAAGRGEIVSRVSGDVAIIGDTVSSVLPRVVAAAFAILAALIGIGAVNPVLMLTALVVLPMQLLALRIHLKHTQPVYRRSREVEGIRSQQVLESLDALPTLTAFGDTDRAQSRIDVTARLAADLVRRTTRLAVKFWGRLNLAELAGLSVILVIGYFLVQNGSASIGGVTAAALLFMNLFDPMGAVLAGIDDLQKAAASLARLVGLLEEPTESPREPSTTDSVQVRGLRHSFGPVTALDGIDLDIAPGEHVAVVGASGAGKSTLATVLSGHLTPDSGTVAVPEAVLVSQENHIFAGTLAEDLRIAAPEATDEELRAALARVGAAGPDWALDARSTPTSPMSNASRSPWPGLCSEIRGGWCWMRRRRKAEVQIATSWTGLRKR
ncbi:ABC transporter transmembrane domain-containing protein [Corynebacterium sputi]|uniref:ABC transporter transmembrane domain-containing protein n=1 Tax=Corynebacterium sputi TaxID=489915 RepID=UPI000419241D|nr:ABC transporter ATP-binding protein [Corynebacterium sputi]